MLYAGLAALGCLLAAAVVVVAIPAPHAAEPVTVSYRADLAKLTRVAPYPAVAPHGLPASWQPVGSGLAVGGANGAGTVTWHLDFATPDGLLASLEESNADAAAFIRRMTNNGTALAPTAVAGRTWHLSVTPDRGQRSLYLTSPAGFTVVVTGNASWAELRQLAASLRSVLSGRVLSGRVLSGSLAPRCSGIRASAGGATWSGVCGVPAGTCSAGSRSSKVTSTRCSGRRWFCSACRARLARSASVSGGCTIDRGHSRRDSTTLISAEYTVTCTAR